MLFVLSCTECGPPDAVKLVGACSHSLPLGSTRVVQVRHYDSDTCCGGYAVRVASVASDHENVIQVVPTNLDAGVFELTAVGLGTARCVANMPQGPPVRFDFIVVDAPTDGGFAGDAGCPALEAVPTATTR